MYDMNFSYRIFVINNINLPPNASFEEAFSVADKKLRKLGIKTGRLSFAPYRKSIDARRKSDIKIVYSVSASGEFIQKEAEILIKNGISEITASTPLPVFGTEELSAPPVIVGTGPAGLFAALMLAEAGYKPIVLERGSRISERIKKVADFDRGAPLDTDTNIQFGAGGAGTFSDGKLITRINDSFSAYVLERFCEFGAPTEIKYLAKPHIGTDILSSVVDKMLAYIESLGARVYYNTKFEKYSADSRGRVTSVTTSRGDFQAGALILAIGHSARDTYFSLLDSGLSAEAKPFSVGMRIEHLSEDIDRAMYGDFAGNENLGRAEYSLSHNTKQRGVYTFCMCPGGEVVAATSEERGTVTNGMSKNARSGINSNSAVVCSVFKEDYGATPKGAIEFQRKIERAAFSAGGSDYSAPIITVGDFLEGKLSAEPKRVLPTYMKGKCVKLADPDSYLPSFVTGGIRNALLAFDKRIEGFAAHDAVLTGAETRTSAPIRLPRDKDTALALGFDNIYPAGEGAGYAGGITSAAIDGIRTAMAFMKRYKRTGEI